MSRTILFILGLGGHARSVADVALSLGYQSLVFIDKEASEKKLLNFPVETKLPALQANYLAMPALGDNRLREQQFNDLQSLSWPIATLIAPSASIGLKTIVGAGSFVAHQVHLGPMVLVGDGCIINSGAVIDHESRIGNFSHVSINTAIAGRCHIGSFNFIGAGAVIINNLTLANEIIVGAGTTVIKNLDKSGTYIGNPARKIK